MKKVMTALAAAAVAVVALAGTAFAHVSVNPDQAAKGSFTELAFRVPNERDDANTVKVEVFFPTDHPIADVSLEPHQGWTAEVDKQKLATPIQSDDGEVTEAVSKITWTGGTIGLGQYDDFEVSVGPLPDDTSSLTFKALQTYSDGQVVRWIDEPVAGGPEPDDPAPVLKLVNDTVAAAPAAAAEQREGDDSDTSDSLAIVALVVGGLALVVGVVALVRGRGRPAA